MREILCSFNLFDAKQIVYLCTEDQQTTVGTADLKNIVNEMLARGEEWNTSTFHFIGNTQMANKLAEELKTKYVLNYGKANEIEVKVN
jgi:hypothetical protein